MLSSALVICAVLLSAFPVPCHFLSFKTSEHLATFDDLSYEFNGTNAINIYSGLRWLHFSQYLPQSTSDVRHGIAPSSPPYYALSSSNLYLEVSVPTTSTAFPLSDAVFFDLHSFNWGCLNLNTSSHTPLLPETPTNCSLSIECFEPRGADTTRRPEAKPSYKLTYFFTVSLVMRIWGVQMTKVLLGGQFTACQTVTWEVRALTGGGTREVALVLDNVKFRTYRITKWGRKGLGELVHENGPYGIA